MDQAIQAVMPVLTTPGPSLIFPQLSFEMTLESQIHDGN